MACKLFSIYSSKGGVGKSFIAANLAVDIQLEAKGKTLLLDMSVPFSVDVACFLNLSGVKRVETLLPSIREISPALLRSYVTPHTSGIFTLSLSSGDTPLSSEVFNDESIGILLDKLKQSFDFILVDVGMKLDSVVEAIFDRSTFIIVPVTPDVLSIQQTKKDLLMFRSSSFPKEMIRLVANMTGKAGVVSEQFMEQQLGRRLAAFIPYDEEALSKLAEGVYPSHFPRHPVSKGIDQLANRIIREADHAVAFSGRSEAGTNTPKSLSSNQDIGKIKREVHDKLLAGIDFKRLDMEVDNDPEKYEELKREVTNKITEIIDNETTIQSREVRRQLLKEILQETLGLGPLEDLLDDPAVSEIMVNRFDQVFVEKKGRLQRVDKPFLSEAHLMNIISRITAPLGRKIDTSTPMVDARLKDGSRVNAIIPPLAINGASLTIRKFPEKHLGSDDLIQYGTCNKQVIEFLKAAVKARLNVLVSGGTGTGKTTLLNVLSSFIPEGERILTIEDSAELKLQQRHVVTLETRPPNIEGKGEITIRDLVKNSLRMRPDRIVVGECRGAEALDMLQAMNTGHDGSLTTIHANSAREALSRVETLVMYAGFELPAKAIRDQIVGAIDLVVQIKRFKDGSRKLIQVSEVTGMEGTVITMGDAFVYKQTGEEAGTPTGTFVSTGYIPHCLEKFKEMGISIPREIFWANT